MSRSRPPAVFPALPRRRRRPLVPLVAGLLAVPFAVGLAIVPSAARAPAAAAATSPCPQSQGSAGWELSTSSFDPAFYRHATVGNGYLGLRVPPAGMGYVSTGEATGWPLFTPRYDGAIVAGLYSRDPDLAGGRQAIAAIPNWSTLTVGAGGETFTPTIAASRITNYRQTLYLRCGLLRTSLTWTTGTGNRATDLVYDVLADQTQQHVGVVRMTMTPHWNGDATVSDVIDGAGARRVVQTGGGPQDGALTQDVTFDAETLGTAGAVASTLAAGPGVPATTTTRTPAANLTASQALTFRARKDQSYEFVKYVGVDTELSSGNPEKSAVAASQQAADQGWSALHECPRRGLGRPVAQRHRAARSAGPAAVGARRALRPAVQHQAGRGRQHQPGRPDQRQLRRVDLLGCRDLDVPGPVADPPRDRQVDRRVPVPDHAGRAGQRAAAGLPGPVLSVEQRQQR